MRRRIALVSLVLVSACTTGPSLETRGAVTASPGDSKHLTIGSAGSTESDLLAQMYALLLNQAGYKTSLLTVANRELYEPALESGRIDVVPEYAATFADWLNAKTNGSDAPPPAHPTWTRRWPGCASRPRLAASPSSPPAAPSTRTPSP